MQNDAEKQNHAALKQAILNEEWAAVRRLLAKLHPADIADLIENTAEILRPAVFELLNDELQADVLAELEDSIEENLLDALSPDQISSIVEEMAPDDAADVLGDMDESRSEKVLSLMDHEDSEEVRELMSYADDSAGGIMTSDFVALPSSRTAQQAIDYIGSLELDEPVHFTYVVDDEGRMIGYVQLWKLLKAGNRNTKLSELIETDIFYAGTDTDQEEVARLMSKYDLSSLPVLDADGRLVGRITVDDILDVMEEEASEDIFKLAGSSDDELEYASAFMAGKARLPWLLITLGTGLITSMVLKSFMHSITAMEIVALSFFVPIVMAMGGNTGIQSSTLIIRGLAVGSFSSRKLHRIFMRELFTGMLMGVICGFAVSLWAHLIIGTTTAYNPAFLAFAVGFALFCAMLVAASFGALVPILLNRFGFDPAVASGPFVTASNDIIALLIYYGIILLLMSVLPV